MKDLYLFPGSRKEISNVQRVKNKIKEFKNKHGKITNSKYKIVMDYNFYYEFFEELKSRSCNGYGPLYPNDTIHPFMGMDIELIDTKAEFWIERK